MNGGNLTGKIWGILNYFFFHWIYFNKRWINNKYKGWGVFIYFGAITFNYIFKSLLQCAVIITSNLNNI